MKELNWFDFDDVKRPVLRAIKDGHISAHGAIAMLETKYKLTQQQVEAISNASDNIPLGESQFHNLMQGSDEWHAFRELHCPASELPMITGNSAYVSRDQAVMRKVTGEQPEISDYQQKIFDKGHETEAKARAILEKEIGVELFTPTLSRTVDGIDLSASMDGMDINCNFGFEHKMLNKNLVAMIQKGELSRGYTDQMDQQMLVSGVQYIIFVCSDGTKNNWHELTYTGNGEFIQTIPDHWKQFKSDCDALDIEPANVIDEKPVKAGLPALNAMNAQQCVDDIIDWIDTLPVEMSSDSECAIAEKATKHCSKLEKAIVEGKGELVAQYSELNADLQALDGASAKLKAYRLPADKAVKSAKQAVKQGIADKAMAKWQVALAEKASALNGQPDIAAPDFIKAMASKRTLASLNDAVNTELASKLVELSGIVDIIQPEPETITIALSEYEHLLSCKATLDTLTNMP